MKTKMRERILVHRFWSEAYEAWMKFCCQSATPAEVRQLRTAIALAGLNYDAEMRKGAKRK